MNSYQNALEWVQDKIKQGVEFEHGPNAEVIRAIGVKLIAGKIPAQVRKELNAAVKAGYLGRLKKDGLLPEAYFHPNSRPRAIEERRREAMQGIEAIKKVCC